MARNVLAPWAEIVPDVGPMTADDLLKLPDDGWRYELVGGVLIRMPPPGFKHGDIALELEASCVSIRSNTIWGRSQRLKRDTS